MNLIKISIIFLALKFRELIGTPAAWSGRQIFSFWRAFPWEVSIVVLAVLIGATWRHFHLVQWERTHPVPTEKREILTKMQPQWTAVAVGYKIDFCNTETNGLCTNQKSGWARFSDEEFAEPFTAGMKITAQWYRVVQTYCIAGTQDIFTSRYDAERKQQLDLHLEQDERDAAFQSEVRAWRTPGKLALYFGILLFLIFNRAALRNRWYRGLRRAWFELAIWGLAIGLPIWNYDSSSRDPFTNMALRLLGTCIIAFILSLPSIANEKPMGSMYLRGIGKGVAGLVGFIGINVGLRTFLFLQRNARQARAINEKSPTLWTGVIAALRGSPSKPKSRKKS